MTPLVRRSRLATRRAAAERASARASSTITPTTGLDLTADAPSRPLRGAIYIRISTDEEHKPFSLEAQELRLRSYIEIQPGWEFVGPIYRDEKSGATLDRPDLNPRSPPRRPASSTSCSSTVWTGSPARCAV